jgi:hypothetical protein
MNAKTLAILAGTLAIVAGGAVLVTRQNAPITAAAANAQKLAPTLADKINDVAKVELRKGTDTLLLTRGKDGEAAIWKLDSRGGYPAKPDKIKELILTLSETKLIEPKTDKPEKFALLELEAPGAEAKGTSITLSDSSGAALASIIVGKFAFSADGRSGEGMFVRRAHENQTYLSDFKLQFEVAPAQWLVTDVLSTERGRLKSATIANAGGSEVPAETYTVSRPDSSKTDFALTPMPAGKELKYAGSATTPTYAIEFVDMADVAPAASIDLSKEPLATCTYQMFDGLIITATLGRHDGKTWLKLAASSNFDGVPDSAKEQDGAEKPVEKDPTKPTLRSHAEVEQEVKDFNSKHAPWAYALVDYKVNQFVPKLADLVKEIEPPAGPAPASGTPGHTPIPEFPVIPGQTPSVIPDQPASK